MPTISTLVPAYNAAAYIGAALDSVADQTRLPDEIVVVNDGSIDDTRQLVEEWIGDHPTLICRLINTENRGASAARNLAIESATSEFIAFLDSDDLLRREHHAKLHDILSLNTHVVTAFGNQTHFTSAGTHSTDFFADKAFLTLETQSLNDGAKEMVAGVWETLVHGNFVPTSASMARRADAMDCGMFDPALGTSEDRDFWLRMAKRGAFAYTGQPLTDKREHEENLSGIGNQLNVSRFAVDVAAKQLRESAALLLTESEREAATGVLREASSAYLYTASRFGWRTFSSAREHLRKHQAPQVPWMRHALRALAATPSA